MAARLEVHRLTPDLHEAFFRFHDAAPRGWCYCVAWWVATWDGWSDRPAERNRRLREDLLARGAADGYLLQADGVTVGWCQSGPRDAWPKLADAHDLPPDPDVWAITCFDLDPAVRGRGWAKRLLGAVLEDLEAHGVRRVQGFPRCGRHAEEEVWTGPEGVFRAHGFRRVGGSDDRPVLEWAPPRS